MSIISNIKNIFALTAVLFLLTACGGGGGGSTTATTETLKVIEIQSSESVVTENEAIIEWMENDYIAELIEYGTSEMYGSEILINEEGTIDYKKSNTGSAVENVVTLSDLEASTTYNYRIVGKDKDGKKVVSNNKTFRTSGPAVCIEGDAKIEGYVYDKETGTGLIGVQVNVGGCVTTTNAQGNYTLTSIAKSKKAIITFNAEGYYKNSTIIQVDQYLEGTTDLSSNYTVVEMDKYISPWTYDSQTVVSGPHITIPAGIYINKDGSRYIGQVTGGLSYRTSGEKGTDIVFPGEYKGKDSNGIIIPFVSYGFTVIDLIDVNGATLSVSENITLTFEETGATENIIPLWYYDYDQGLWIEKGYAERQSDGMYKGEISHPGTWSLSQAIEEEVGFYRGHIIDVDGLPISDVRVHAVGDNWISSDLSTDENGLFEIEVIPGKSFQLTAYNYKDKYGAEYNGIIAAVASGDVVEE